MDYLDHSSWNHDVADASLIMFGDVEEVLAVALIVVRNGQTVVEIQTCHRSLKMGNFR